MNSVLDMLTENADSVVSAEVGGSSIRWHFDGAPPPLSLGDAELALGIMPAMRKGEDLRVTAPVSPRLLDNTGELQRLLHSWHPEMTPVSVNAPHNSAVDPAPKGAGLFFSGGVDSFYSLLNHRHELTHLVTLNGLEGIHDERVVRMAKDVARAEHLEAIVITTDARTAVDGLPWQGLGHGAVLASAGLLLQADLSHLYIASSKHPAHLEPAGTHPDLDPLWSTETLTFQHDELVPRLDKVLAITGYPAAMQHLRVCWRKPGLYNCGACEKCTRTMVALELAGGLGRCRTLPSRLDLPLIANQRLEGRALRRARVLERAAEEAGRGDLAAALRRCVGRSTRRNQLRAPLRWARRTIRRL